jgi:hypothetical protein
MCAKSNKRRILNYLPRCWKLVVAYCLICSCWALYGAMPKELRNTGEPFNPSPGIFASTNAIDTYFETNGLPAVVKEVQTKSTKYCFVWAFPYSGMDATLLYCYVKYERGWMLYFQAGLIRTDPNADLKFKANGDYVDVIREGELLFKIKSIPDKPAINPKGSLPILGPPKGASPNGSNNVSATRKTS